MYRIVVTEADRSYSYNYADMESVLAALYSWRRNPNMYDFRFVVA